MRAWVDGRQGGVANDKKKNMEQRIYRSVSVLFRNAVLKLVDLPHLFVDFVAC